MEQPRVQMGAEAQDSQCGMQLPEQTANWPHWAEQPGSSSGLYLLRHFEALTCSPQRKRCLVRGSRKEKVGRALQVPEGLFRI